MKTFLTKFDSRVWKPVREWMRKFWDKGDDNDPYGNNPYVIL